MTEFIVSKIFDAIIILTRYTIVQITDVCIVKIDMERRSFYDILLKQYDGEIVATI